MNIIKQILVFFFMLVLLTTTYASTAIIIGKPLPPWRRGYLDIHHIHEGRGNATFMIFPDGTTLLYDVGDVALTNLNSNNLQQYSGILPNNSKSPYEWVADYIKQFSPHGRSLDYLVISHYHFDHMGEWDAHRPEQQKGHYRLFGVTGIFERIHVHTLIDRSYPDYQHHGDITGNLDNYLHGTNEYEKLTALTMRDYQRFIQYQIETNKLQVEKFQVGSDSQIHLMHYPYANFLAHNIIGNGYVWSGKDASVYQFIKYAKNDINAKKTENDLALGIRIDYGKFRYFTGSDITGLELTGKQVDTSAEAVAAPVIGRVDVATLDHHGFADAQSKFFVAALRPRVWVQQNWAASQTSLPMLRRTFDTSIYLYPPDLFALHHFQHNDLALSILSSKTKPTGISRYDKNSMGHIVVRVTPGGKSYWIIMLTSDTAKPVIKAFYGPYQCLGK